MTLAPLDESGPGNAWEPVRERRFACLGQGPVCHASLESLASFFSFALFIAPKPSASYPVSAQGVFLPCTYAVQLEHQDHGSAELNKTCCWFSMTTPLECRSVKVDLEELRANAGRGICVAGEIGFPMRSARAATLAQRLSPRSWLGKVESVRTFTSTPLFLSNDVASAGPTRSSPLSSPGLAEANQPRRWISLATRPFRPSAITPPTHWSVC